MATLSELPVASISTSTRTNVDPSQDLILPIQRRLSDIRSFQLPRLRDCRGPLGLQRDLAWELKGDLDRVQRDIEWNVEVAESLRPRERDKTVAQLDLLASEHKDLCDEYRQALLISKRAVGSSSKRHNISPRRSKGDLVNGDGGDQDDTNGDQSRRGETGADDALQTKTNEFTDALRRTTTIMQAELERSVLSVQMLDQSTQTLRLTQTLYDTYTSLLLTSSTLVKSLEKADFWDRLVIFSAFLLFLLVVGWVIKRRVLDRVVGGVMGGVGWWVGGSWKLIKMGLRSPASPNLGGSESGGGLVETLTGGQTTSIASVVSEAMSTIASMASPLLHPPDTPSDAPRDEL